MEEFDFTGDQQYNGVASRIPCAVGEPQGIRHLLNRVFHYSNQRWPSSWN